MHNVVLFIGSRSMPSAGPSHQVLLDDLTSVIDVALMTAFATAIHLLRRRSITVATLAHCLCVAFLIVTVGHYIETHLIGGSEEMERFIKRHCNSPERNMLAEWSKAGILSTIAVSMLVARFWVCKGVGVDCVVGEHAGIHYPCKLRRLKFFGQVFSWTAAFVYFCACARLNAVLGGSVLHPEGGGHALAVLTTPALGSAICISSCVSVWLYSVLVEAQGIDVSRDENIRSGNSDTTPSSVLFPKILQDDHDPHRLDGTSGDHRAASSYHPAEHRRRRTSHGLDTTTAPRQRFDPNDTPQQRASLARFDRIPHRTGAARADSSVLIGRDPSLTSGGGGLFTENFERNVPRIGEGIKDDLDPGWENISHLPSPYPGQRRVRDRAAWSPQLHRSPFRKFDQESGPSHETSRRDQLSSATLREEWLDRGYSANARRGTRSVCSDGLVGSRTRLDDMAVDDTVFFPRESQGKQPHQFLRRRFVLREHVGDDGGGGNKRLPDGTRTDATDFRIMNNTGKAAVASNSFASKNNASADGWTSTSSSSSGGFLGDDAADNSSSRLSARATPGHATRGGVKERASNRHATVAIAGVNEKAVPDLELSPNSMDAGKRRSFVQNAVGTGQNGVGIRHWGSRNGIGGNLFGENAEPIQQQQRGQKRESIPPSSGVHHPRSSGRGKACSIEIHHHDNGSSSSSSSDNESYGATGLPRSGSNSSASEPEFTRNLSLIRRNIR